MKNYQILENEHIQTPFGILAGITSYFCYTTGELEGVNLCEKNMVVTHVGELIPAYIETDRRKNKYSVEFYKGGTIKAVALNEQQGIQTPIGEFPAELVTFFETGELNRFFPLDGKISGFWNEEDERGLQIPFSFDLGFTKFTALLSSVAFHKSGDIKSVTLYPGETLSIKTTCGDIETRNGFSLYETGGLESLEPAIPALIETPIGKITAYDPNAIGVNADNNSLVFDVDGKIKKVVTVSNTVIVQQPNGKVIWFKPQEVPHPLEEDVVQVNGTILIFDQRDGTVQIEGENTGVFNIKECDFNIIQTEKANGSTCLPSDCKSCSLCNKSFLQ